MRWAGEEAGIDLRKVKHRIRKGQSQGHNSYHRLGVLRPWPVPLRWVLVTGLSQPKSQMVQGGQEGSVPLGLLLDPTYLHIVRPAEGLSQGRAGVELGLDRSLTQYIGLTFIPRALSTRAYPGGPSTRGSPSFWPQNRHKNTKAEKPKSRRIAQAQCFIPT